MKTWLMYKADEATAIEHIFTYLPGVQSLDEVRLFSIFDLTLNTGGMVWSVDEFARRESYESLYWPVYTISLAASSS